MGILKKLGRGIERAGKSLIKYTSPLGSALVSAHDGRKAQRAANKEQAVQRGMIEAEAAATQAERNRISQERSVTQAERNRISQERSVTQAKTTVGSRKANRRRVKGGLFGDANVDTNTSPRLG